MLHKFQVSFYLDDEQYDKLKIIQEYFIENGHDISYQNILEHAMSAGSKKTIDENLNSLIRIINNKKSIR